LDVREYLIPQLLQPREVGLSGVKLEDDRVPLPDLQSLGPHRLGDGQYTPIDRIGDLGVEGRLSVSERDQFLRKPFHVDHAFVHLDLFATNEEPFELDRRRTGHSGSKLGKEGIGCVRE